MLDFAGSKFQSDGQGVYWLLYAGTDFYVQTVQNTTSDGGNALSNKAVYIRYGSGVVEVTASRGDLVVNVNGRALITNGQGNKQVNQIGNVRIVSGRRNKLSDVVFDFTDTFGSQTRSARFRIRPSCSGTNIDVIAKLGAEWEGKVSGGLCNPYTAASNTNKLTLANTTVLSLSAANAKVFSASWRVACKDVAFKAFPVKNCTVVPPPPPVVVPPACPAITNISADVCSLACVYKQQCITDVNSTCSLEASQAHIAAFEQFREDANWDACGGSWCNPCNGQGTCNNGVCNCTAGYSGAQCQLQLVPDTCTPNCVNGFCNSQSQCICATGWTGPNCNTIDVPAPCGNACNNHGDCVQGLCHCQAGFYGATCEHTVPACTTVSTCTVVGDPHYTTFDKFYYSYQGHGVFYTVYSQDLVIQSWHKPWVCDPNNFVQAGVAIQYKDTLLQIYAGDVNSGPRIRLANVAYPMSQFFTAMHTNRYTTGSMTLINGGTNRMVVQFDATDLITISVAKTGGTEMYINLAIQLAKRYYGQTAGMCGTWTGTSTDDYWERYAVAPIAVTNTNLYAKFGPSWQVPCAQVLLSDLPAGTCDVLPTPVPTPAPGRCDAVLGVAEIVCQAACTTYAQCVHDVYAACNTKAALPHIDMHNAVQEVWQGPKCHETPPVCQNECSMHGVCVSNGLCVCQEGFSGADCSILPCVGGCGNGVCDDGVCSCNEGWSGAQCDAPVCSPACGANGVCSAPNTCDCNQSAAAGYWTGATCSKCAAGYKGTDCKTRKCPENCNGNGQCEADGTCTCDSGYTGDTCDLQTEELDMLTPTVICRLPTQDGTEGALVFGVVNDGDAVIAVPVGKFNKFTPGNKDRNQPTVFAPGTIDSYLEGGIVVEFDPTASLTWKLGTNTVTGDGNTPLCVVPCDAPHCSGHGQCVVGRCVCDAGYMGDDCGTHSSAIHPVGLCNMRHTNGTNTALFSYYDTSSESMYKNEGESMAQINYAGHAKAVFSFNNKTVWLNASSPGCKAPCPKDCSGHGVCDGGLCICADEYTGHDCSVLNAVVGNIVPVVECVSRPCPSCPQTAVFGYVSTNAQSVELVAGTWNSVSPAQDGLTLPTSFASGTHHSVLRVVFPETGTNSIVWKLGSHVATASAATASCSYACPSNCSGRGDCDSLAGTCSCAVGWTGSDCSVDNRVTLVTPVAICYGQVSETEYVARFGYQNANSETIVVHTGPMNKILPNGDAPITTFEAGSHLTGSEVGEVRFAAGATVTWKLGSRTAVASNSIAQCNDGGDVFPDLQCVADNGDGSYTAYFGWVNSNSIAVTASVAVNYFSPANSLLSTDVIPSTFMPGKSAQYPHSPILAVFNNDETVTWFLTGLSAQASSASEPCPASNDITTPTVISAKLANDLTSILIVLDYPSADAFPQDNLACGDWFSSIPFSYLGVDPVCTWLTTHSFTVTLGVDVVVLPGMTLFDANSPNPQSDIALSPPNSPVTPTVTLVAPTSSLVCHNVDLDASSTTGGGGRAFTFEWEVVSGPSSTAVASTKESLAFCTDDNAVCTIGYLTPGPYVFQVTATDFLGQVAVDTTTVLVLAGESQLSVDISGPNAFAVEKGALPLELQAVPGFACDAPVTSGITYQWTVTPLVTLTAAQSTSSRLVLPVTMLSPEVTYTLSVRATSTVSGATAVASVTVSVLSGPITAVLTGVGSYFVTEPVTLSASSSTDADTGSNGGLMYEWSCYLTANGQPCVNNNGDELTMPETATLTIAANTVPAGTYNFGVLVYSADGRSDLTHGLVTMEENGLAVSIVPLTGAVQTNQALTLWSSVRSVGTTTATLSWQLTTGALTQSAALCYTSSLTGPSLSIAANCLQAGVLYTFTLSATDAGATRSATISFTPVVAPVGGQMDASPSNGGLGTQFTVSTSGWSNIRQPALYQFFYRTVGSSQLYALSTGQSSARLNTYLPAGSIEVSVVVTNANGARATASVVIQVDATMTNGLNQVIDNIIDQQLPNCVHTANWDRCLGLASRAVFYLNSGGFPAIADQQVRREKVLAQLAAIQTGLGNAPSGVGVVWSLTAALLSHANYVTATAQATVFSMVNANMQGSALEQSDTWDISLGVVVNVMGQLAATQMSTADTNQMREMLTNVLLRMILLTQNGRIDINTGMLSVTMQSVPVAHIGTADFSSFGQDSAFVIPGAVQTTMSTLNNATIQTETWWINPYPTATGSNAVMSAVQSMSIYSNNVVTSVSNLLAPIVIRFDKTEMPFVGSPVCGYYNTASNAWRTDGCTYDADSSANSTQHVCLCTHLTDFAVLDSAVLPTDTDVAPASLPVYAIALIVTGGAIIVAVAIVLLFRCRRQKAAADVCMTDISALQRAGSYSGHEVRARMQTPPKVVEVAVSTETGDEGGDVDSSDESVDRTPAGQRRPLFARGRDTGSTLV